MDFLLKKYLLELIHLILQWPYFSKKKNLIFFSANSINVLLFIKFNQKFYKKNWLLPMLGGYQLLGILIKKMYQNKIQMWKLVGPSL
jgi:hypothetical protein